MAGSIGAMVAAVGGVELFGRTQVGRDAYPAPDIRVDVRQGLFRSRHMKSRVGWGLSLPTLPPIATVFSLHGRDGDHTRTFEQLKLQNFVAASNLPLAIAAVDGGDHSYWHERKDGTDAMSMLLNEFVPMIEQQTRTTRRALYGWSMGGYGALLAAEARPSYFCAVTALSPALWLRAGDSAPGAFDSKEDFVLHDVFANRDRLSSTRVRISCGTSDPFYSAVTHFVTGNFSIQIDFGPGKHEPAYWRRGSTAALKFIADSCA